MVDLCRCLCPSRGQGTLGDRRSWLLILEMFLLRSCLPSLALFTCDCVAVGLSAWHCSVFLFISMFHLLLRLLCRQTFSPLSVLLDFHERSFGTFFCECSCSFSLEARVFLVGSIDFCQVVFFSGIVCFLHVASGFCHSRSRLSLGV